MPQNKWPSGIGTPVGENSPKSRVLACMSCAGLRHSGNNTKSMESAANALRCLLVGCTLRAYGQKREAVMAAQARLKELLGHGMED